MVCSAWMVRIHAATYVGEEKTTVLFEIMLCFIIFRCFVTGWRVAKSSLPSRIPQIPHSLTEKSGVSRGEFVNRFFLSLSDSNLDAPIPGRNVYVKYKPLMKSDNRHHQVNASDSVNTHETRCQKWSHYSRKLSVTLFFIFLLLANRVSLTKFSIDKMAICATLLFKYLLQKLTNAVPKYTIAEWGPHIPWQTVDQDAAHDPTDQKLRCFFMV